MRIRAFAVGIAALFLISGTAQASVPAATTGGFSNLTPTTAHVSGSVKPNGENTAWHFEYGTTTAYGSSAPVPDGQVAAGSGSTPVAADLGNLQPGTVYHYRLVATNPSGSIPGKDRTLTTRPAVSIVTNATTFLFGHSVTITGHVFGTAVSGITVKLLENPYPFPGFNEVSTTTTDTAGNYQFIRPVLTNTAYKVTAQTKPAGTSGTAFAYEQDIVTLKANTSRPRRGHSVLFTGTNVPARVGSQIRIQRLGRHGWRTVLRATLTATNIPNTASYSVRLKRAVTGVYRAYSPGTFDHLAGASATKRIRVRR